jgi:chromosome partitioning protein
MHIIAVINIAGGVGKTTTTVNLGHALARRGRRVLLVDLDPQGNTTTYLGTASAAMIADALLEPADFARAIGPARAAGVEVAHGSLDTAGAEVMLAAQPTTAATRIRKGLRTINDRYDFVLIDAPPAPGILTINAIAAANEIIIPVETKPKALEGVGNMRQLLGQIVGDEDLMPNGPPPATYLATRHDARTVLDRDCLAALRADDGYPTFATVIRSNQKIPESYAARTSVLDYDPKSYGALDHEALAEEYLTRGE